MGPWRLVVPKCSWSKQRLLRHLNTPSMRLQLCHQIRAKIDSIWCVTVVRGLVSLVSAISCALCAMVTTRGWMTINDVARPVHDQLGYDVSSAVQGWEWNCTLLRLTCLSLEQCSGCWTCIS